MGILAGIGTMFFFDPDDGRHRRALVRDKLLHYSKKAPRMIQNAHINILNRLHGLVYDIARSFQPEPGVADDVLEGRVLSKVGHVMEKPGVIEVKARNGVISLSGPVYPEESEKLLTTIAIIPGVQKIENHLKKRQVSRGR